MAEEWEGPDFDYAGMPVGYFLYAGPKADGPARYMPFRGPGHYEMAQAVRSGDSPQCVYQGADGPVTFNVVDIPEYGVLTLANVAVG